MNSLLAVQNLPTPVKAGLVLAGGGSAVGVVGMISPKIAIGLGVGLAAVALLLLLYRLVLKMLDKRKSNPFAKSIQQTSAAPAAISEPAKRARLDDLRRTFESGVEKFRAAGKDLYSVPWYLLVGEPGSGKTEAIRHSSVGFPPGLQDQLQGAGGTLNMNWWFTMHAIILDTAGRLLFEEAPPGQTSEWQEFLKLLRKARPNCPINGMLLVVPADSLIRDRADAIEKKAGKIAQQLDNIQRALSVRFPVFVIVTKCDLVNGFREFFDTLEDPQLQHQMVGWTNAAELDQPFKPEQVEQHLNEVRARVVRRRMLMLQDPVHTEDPSQRRIDQVDALYSFPDSLMQIGPRLKRYLEMIFVAGEWSSKPLFLRGIYFTSSMREGSALDADLAEALGVSLESLPEGRVWERDRAYFLRDLFIGKVFKEKGLVTRAGNVRKTQRARRMAVMGTAAATILLLLGLTVWSALAFKRTIDGQRILWSSVRAQTAEGADSFDLLSKQREFLGHARLGKLADKPEVASFVGTLPAAATSPMNVPAVFRPVARMSGDLSAQRLDAARAIVEAGVLRCAVESAMDRLDAEPADKPWSEEATAALAQVVRLDSLAAGVVPAGSVLVDAEALYRYALAEQYKDNTVAIHDAQKACDALLTPESWRKAAETLVARPAMQKRIAEAASRWVSQWDAAGVQGGTLGALQELRLAVADFKGAEDKILEIGRPYFEKGEPSSSADYDRMSKTWDQEHARLSGAAGGIRAALDKLKADLAKNPSVPALCQSAGGDALSRAQKQFDTVRSQTRAAAGSTPAPAPKPGEAAPAPPASRLAPTIDAGADKIGNKLRELSEGVRAELAGAEKDYVAVVPGTDRRVWELRADMYHAADERLKAAAKPAAPAFGELASTAKASATQDAAALTTIGESVKASGALPRAQEAEKTSGIMVRLAKRRTVLALIQSVLDSPPTAGAPFDGRMTELLARANIQAAPGPTVPLTRLAGAKFEPRFAPAVARQVLGDWAFIGEAVSTKEPAPGAGGPTRALDAELLTQKATVAREGYQQYAQDYIKYWSEDVPAQAAIAPFASWSEFYQKVADTRPISMRTGVEALLAACTDALSEAPDTTPGVVDARQKIAGQRRLIDDKKPDVPFEETWKAVLDLGRDSEAARQALLGAKPTDLTLTDKLLKRYSETAPGIQYLNDLVLAVVRILADEAEGAVRASRTEVAGQAAFPLCQDCPGTRTLTPPEFAAARAAIARLAVAPKPPTGAPETIGQGAATNNINLDKQFGRLRGDRALASDKEREWVRRMKLVADFLRDQPPQNCTLEILKIDDQVATSADAAPAVDDFIWLDLTAGPGEPVHLNTRQARPAAAKFPLPGPAGARVSLRFTKAEGQEGTGDVTLPEFWSVARLILAPGAKVEEGGLLLKAPVTFDAAGKRYVYWVGVKFERPVPWPPADAWPAHDQWPAATP